MGVFVQWEGFNEWYERRDWIGIILMLFLFFALLITLLPRSLFLTHYVPYVLVVVSYIIVGFIIFFIIWKIQAWVGLIGMIVIFGVIIAVIEIAFWVHGISISFGVLFVLAILWFGGLVLFEFFVLVFLALGLRHPERYVKGYTVICFFWDLFCVYNLVNGWSWWSVTGAAHALLLFKLAFVSSFLPLIPIWYWCYKYEEEMYALRKRWLHRLSQKHVETTH